MNRANEYGWLRDQLLYNDLYAPDEYPEEDETTFDKELAELQVRMTRLLETSRRDPETTWIRLALVALSEAKEAYDAGKPQLCQSKFSNAEGWLTDAERGRPVEATMIAGPETTERQ